MIEGHYRRGTYTHETSTAAAVVIRAKAVLVIGAVLVALVVLNSAAAVVGVTFLVIAAMIFLAMVAIVGLVLLGIVSRGVEARRQPLADDRRLTGTVRPGLTAAAAEEDLRWTTESVKVTRR